MKTIRNVLFGLSLLIGVIACEPNHLYTKVVKDEVKTVFVMGNTEMYDVESTIIERTPVEDEYDYQVGQWYFVESYRVVDTVFTEEVDTLYQDHWVYYTIERE
jgi:hypothetical protein